MKEKFFICLAFFSLFCQIVSVVAAVKDGAAMTMTVHCEIQNNRFAFTDVLRHITHINKIPTDYTI